MSSWAEDVNAYRESKRAVVPPAMNNERRAYRDARYNKQDEHRQYDIVVQQHRDGAKESENRSRELSQSVVLRQQAKQQSLRYEYKWDVVSHQPKDIGVVDVPRRRITKAVPAPDRTLIDNHLHTRGMAAARLKTEVEQRDFDMISNQQFRDHASWAKQQDEEAKTQIEEKYWKTNHFDSVKGIFYHPEEEKRFQEERTAAQLSHGQSRLQALPPSIRTSEGQLVNLTSLQLRTDRTSIHGDAAAATLVALDKKNHKSRGGHEARDAIESHIKAEQQHAAEVAAQRRLNTIHLTGRVAQGPSQSYHLLTNTMFPPAPIQPLSTVTTSSLPAIGTGTVVPGGMAAPSPLGMRSTSPIRSGHPSIDTPTSSSGNGEARSLSRSVSGSGSGRNASAPSHRATSSNGNAATTTSISSPNSIAAATATGSYLFYAPRPKAYVAPPIDPAFAPRVPIKRRGASAKQRQAPPFAVDKQASVKPSLATSTALASGLLQLPVPS